VKLPRNAQIWLPGYLKDRLGSRPSGPATVWLAICDHYEPYWRNQDDELARQRVAQWVEHWPRIAARHSDDFGGKPQYCFFYPEEEYRPWLLDSLAGMVHDGLGDVEIHLHHDNDTEAAFIERMGGFLETLHTRHGLLHEEDGRPVFAFIHGNWCLDNSRPDGRWCGLNNEITLLRRMGCYADLTFPSGASPTQPRTVNQIYFATDDPAKPRSYDFGTAVTPGGRQTGDLLMIPGPFGLRWRERLVPRMEAGDLAGYDLPTPYRAARWLDLAPRLGGDIFLKLHTHGTQERNSRALLEGGLDRLFQVVGEACRQQGHQLRFATAWTIRNRIEVIRLGEPAGH
jgi:hypothetical protein